LAVNFSYTKVKNFSSTDKEEKMKRIICILVFLGLLLSGCSASDVMTETSTEVPANTPVPSTPTPVPTSTPTTEPTLTLTSTPTDIPPTSTPIPVDSDVLAESIFTLRGLDYENIDDEQSAAINEAIQTLIDAGSEGARMLKEEITAIDEAGEIDVFFKLIAAWGLWDIGGADEADTIAGIWLSIPPEDWIYRSLFLPGIQAASTQDPRVLPMLKVLLSDKDGVYYSLHMPIEFPLTHEFVWGAYGSKAMPVLHEMLKTSENPVVLESAITQLASAQYLPALPEIRELTNSEDWEIQDAAIYALGEFAHPDDFDLLVSGLLATSNPLDQFVYTYALVEFGDLRAVSYLIPLLDSFDERLRTEAAWGLGHYLASPEGLNALMETAESSDDQQWADGCESLVDNVLESAGVTWEEYQALPKSEQEMITENFRYSANKLEEGEQPITHDEFLAAIAEWQESGYLGFEFGDEIDVRHILPIAEPEDIDLLLDAKAVFYLRISDECLYDARFVDELIKWIGRSRYCTDSGVPGSCTGNGAN